MNSDEQSRWKSEVLDVVFEALAASEALTSLLVYKGARVLNRRLRSSDRQSLDIDSNLVARAAAALDREEQMRVLEQEIAAALDRHFETEVPVRYELEGVRVKPDPKLGQAHPLGWDAFRIRLQIRDLRRVNVVGLPALEIDVAAPEMLLEGSTEPLEVGGHEVVAYSLPRLAGEKLRAFLSTLPEYRRKVRRQGEAIRVKDIYDLGRIAREYPPEEEDAFWRQVGAEFRVACESRFVDCQGVSTFEQNLEVIRQSYENSPILPADIPFGQAWAVVRTVVHMFETWEVVPFQFPLLASNR
jgi:hypothetical protein